ncbi:GNAT family N-acetyltransferase [Bacillus sp. JJ1609]|uniref:GNAT family N-acetyltransferase n=1 Tax=Bacillus sp. JJ1609 TaxID=3122977 RepID=UPI002FFF2E56
MQIRRAEAGDALGIARVHIESWKETYAGIISQEYLDSLKIEDRMGLWKRSLSQTPQLSPVFVAVNEENNIVGFASYGKERTEKFNADGELYAIYILKKYQRERLGLKLLHAGVDELLEQKYTSMLVWVLEENKSRKFYESLLPVKAGEEIDKIAGKEVVELAYVWDDLKALKQKLIHKLKSEKKLT